MAKKYKVGFVYRLDKELLEDLSSEGLKVFPGVVENQLQEMLGFDVVSYQPQQVGSDSVVMVSDVKNKLSLNEIQNLSDLIISHQDINGEILLECGVKVYEWKVIDKFTVFILSEWLTT